MRKPENLFCKIFSICVRSVINFANVIAKVRPNKQSSCVCSGAEGPSGQSEDEFCPEWKIMETVVIEGNLTA